METRPVSAHDNKYTQKLILNFKESFVNDYSFWKTIIDSTNSAIKLQHVSSENATSTTYYSYDEFCVVFIEHVKQLAASDTFSQQLVQQIMLKMIQDK